MLRAFHRYDKSVKCANEQYSTEVVSEYRLAADTAETAWRLMTGDPSTTPRAFEALLLGVMGATEASEKAEDIELSLPRREPVTVS